MIHWRLIFMAALTAGIAISPLADAVAKLNAKTPIGAKLNSAEWENVPLALRERAQLSANVESVKLLATIQDKLQKRLSLTRESVANGEAFVDRSSFIADIRALAVQEGVQTTGKSGAGTLRDIRSSARLGMIFDQQTRSAAEYANWKTGQDADVLDAFPCQELIRVEDRQVPRAWAARWTAAGGQFYEGRMIARKDAPVWSAISRFGTPWPPFDFGSGMGVEDVDRDEAERLGVITGASIVYPTEADFNAELQTSTQSLPPAARADLKRIFGDQIKMYPNTAKWQPDAVVGFVGKVTRERQIELDPFRFGVASSSTVKASPDVNLDGVTLKLPTDWARHIWDRHGPQSTPSSDNIPLQSDEFRYMATIWRQPKQITYHGQEDTCVLWEQTPAGQWIRLVVQKNGEKSAQILSFNKRPNGP